MNEKERKQREDQETTLEESFQNLDAIVKRLESG